MSLKTNDFLDNPMIFFQINLMIFLMRFIVLSKGACAMNKTLRVPEQNTQTVKTKISLIRESFLGAFVRK